MHGRSGLGLAALGALAVPAAGTLAAAALAAAGALAALAAAGSWGLSGSAHGLPLGCARQLLRVRGLRGLQAACGGGACWRLRGRAMLRARKGWTGGGGDGGAGGHAHRGWAMAGGARKAKRGRCPTLPRPEHGPNAADDDDDDRPDRRARKQQQPAPAAVRKRPRSKRLAAPAAAVHAAAPRIAPGKRHRVMPSARTIRTIAQPALVYG